MIQWIANIYSKGVRALRANETVAKKEIVIGVRELLEMIFNPKDLGAAFTPATRGQEGSEGHRLIISERPAGYQSEVPIEFHYSTDDYQLTVRGRIDGLLVMDEQLLVEEIKTTYIPVEKLQAGGYPIHEAQLKLYLYFVMAQNPETVVVGRLTYLNLDNLSERSFPIHLSPGEAAVFFQDLAETYLSHCRSCDSWRRIRNESLAGLWFPFRERRTGQDELMDMVTLALEQERDLFAEAATGIGKTIAVLYPTLKQLETSNRFSQVFFLTAKTAGKEILRKTVQTLQKQGLRLRTVFIEAKERVCFTPGAHCRPQNCPYAQDYYAKVAQVLPGLLEQELITPELVLDTARQGQVCPFELSLDLALQADLIVCDYNYVFDPGVYLRRFFLNTGRRDFVFLIDEAHNLVTRGREMYSASLSQRDLNRLRNELRAYEGKLAPVCEQVLAFFDNWRLELAESRRPGELLSHLPDMLEPALERLVAVLELILKERLALPLRDRIQEFYFNLTAFTRIASLVNEDYAIYVKQETATTEEPGGTEDSRKEPLRDNSDPDTDTVLLRLFCINPGPLLRKRLDQGRSAVFFSATLSPFDYFHELLGGGPDALTVCLYSPFPQETRLYLHVPGIDTRFRTRSQSAAKLARLITEFVTIHTGNYLIFFPSYTYLQTLAQLLKPMLTGKVVLTSQFPGMKDAQKQEFLRRVTATGTGRSNVGLAVLGGLFGEGVDLPGEELVGVLIVGPGLPVVSEEQELIRMYFEERNNTGFLFAYLIPGLIRVIQSAGRVFRTPEDKGVVVLVDDRFQDPNYQELLPSDWFMTGRVFTNPDYLEALRSFWEE